MSDEYGSGLVPSYYEYYGSPVKIVNSPEGVRVWRLSIDDGSWMAKNELFAKIVLDVGGEVYTRSVDRFVQETEAFRGHYLSGEGPVFALYETVQAILDTAEREGRRLTPTEETLIRGIRRKTFVMFEEELQRAGSPGADPDPPRP